MIPINIQISQLIQFINEIDMLATNMKMADEVIVHRLNSILDDVMDDFKNGYIELEVFGFLLSVYGDIKMHSNVMNLCQVEGRSISEWDDSINRMKSKLNLMILKLEGKF